MSTVPNTTNFTLQDVVNAVQPSFNSLRTCMNEADDALFDPAYKGNKDRLSNFRNYGNVIVGGYGYLYNWYIIENNVNNLINGLHIPSDTEFITLSDYLGGDTVSGGKLKEKEFLHWDINNTGTDNFNFSAVGNGTRSENDGAFANLMTWGSIWSSTIYSGSAIMMIFILQVQTKKLDIQYVVFET